jgi:hemolysin III
MFTEAKVAVLDDPSSQQPLLRGVLHLGAFIAAIAGGAWLLLIAEGPSAYVGGAIFAASLILLYGTSASYHRIRSRPLIQRTLRRMDHAMIFVLIGGTYTPFCLKISLAWGIPILSVVWAIAGVGVLLRVFWLGGPRWLRVTLYVMLGWLALIAAPELLEEFPPVALIMLVLGGVLYTLGGLVYAAQRPDPWPRVFGYHEAFHLLVIGGSAVHYLLIGAFVMKG